MPLIEKILFSLAEYGPLAIVCGVLLYMQWQNFRRMDQALTNRENLLVSLVEKTTAAIGDNSAATARLIEELRERPCLHESGKRRGA